MFWMRAANYLSGAVLGCSSGFILNIAIDFSSVEIVSNRSIAKICYAANS
jgi:hypothetical protein